MTYRNNVFPDRAPLGKHRAMELLAAGWARLAAQVGKGSFADRLGVNEATINNALRGKTMPEAHTMLNSLAVCRTALDEPLREMGLRVVPVDAVCDTDTGTVPIAALLHRVAEAESPASPGGVAKTHSELLDMEDGIRAVHRLTGDWLDRIAAIRTPRAVA